MTYTARLKVSCDNKDLLSKLSYTLLNTTTQKSYGGKIDPNGCTKIYSCNKLDLIFVELILNNAKTNSISTSNQFKCYSSKLVNNAKTLIKSDARET